MGENQDRVRVRVRVKERIPEEERRAPRRKDTTLWIVATVLLGICLGYIIAAQLLNVIRAPRVDYSSTDEGVVKASLEKMVLEHEDLAPSPTPASTPGIP